MSLKNFARNGQDVVSHGYASGITRGYQDESPCGDLWLLCLKLVTLHNLITL